MKKINIENHKDLKIIKTSTYVISCPYCKKELKAVYIKQLNQHYNAHVKHCKDAKR